MGAPYIDYATGLNAAFAVMAAPEARTDKHQIVDVAMLDTAQSNGQQCRDNCQYGCRDSSWATRQQVETPSSGCFETRDGGLIMLAANNERQFKDLCRVLGHGGAGCRHSVEQPDGPCRKSGNAARGVDGRILDKSAQDWEVMLDQAGVPASRVRTLKEVMSEGQPEARSLLGELKVGDAQIATRLPAIGFRLNGDSLLPERPPRKVGEDNERYLS